MSAMMEVHCFPRVRVGYEMVVSHNHLVSNKREWNNRFIKNAHKISRTRPTLFF